MRTTEIALLLPILISLWKTRGLQYRMRRRLGLLAWTVVSAVALLNAGGCGGAPPVSNSSNSGLRYTPPGSYQYQVTASSTNGSAQITQSVTLNLIVQ
jgi:hypothetical protein